MKGVLLAALIATLGASAPAAAETSTIRFVAFDVYLESEHAVAAWQFELIDRNGQARIVGVENGESSAYERAPYFDREAINLGQSDRVVVADYSLAAKEALPSGRFRLATVHLVHRSEQETRFEIALINASRPDGTAIDASISLAIRTGSQQ